ncbi:MAG: S8 family serine peptidase [Clostridiales bacterium]|nr:S8 family serine peptidase [Clostridiales bacterium]HBM80856.1 peptidase S8 [Clostridiaceae bacterium]
MLFFSRKLDPVVKLKLKEKDMREIPVIILLKEPPSARFKNSISKKRGKLKYEYKYLKGLSASLSLDEVDRLSELPEVLTISYDRKATVCMDNVRSCIGIGFSTPYNLTGKGVNIAVVDTGVYPHADLFRSGRTILSFRDFVKNINEPYDDNGHGTHICGVIAGSGVQSSGKYKGIASGAKIIMLKALSGAGTGSFSDILAALEYVLENKDNLKIKILCLPFGAEPIVERGKDPLLSACTKIAESGIIIVAPSGNSGPGQGTILTPGISPSVITVGCLNCPDSNIRSWSIPDLSGSGSSKSGETKPDVIAPGVGIMSLSSDTSYIPNTGRMKSLENPYCKMTGSSVSSAVAAGCIALILEKMPSITLKDLKGMLKLSCKTLNELKISQGYGVINIQNLF